MDMTNVIAYRNVPIHAHLKAVVNKVANSIRGELEGLYMERTVKGQRQTMTAYIRLSPQLNRDQVMKRHRIVKWAKSHSIVAFIPTKMPEGFNPLKRPIKIKNSLAKYLNIKSVDDPGVVFAHALLSTLRALEAKYTELYKLSATKEHKLLDKIVATLKDRLMEVMAGQPKDVACHKLTQLYRERHPHTTDFALVMDTLHKIEEEEGSPKTDLKEEDLMKPVKTYSHEGFLYSELRASAEKYQQSIITKVLEHIEALDANESTDDTEEMKYRKKVREHLKRMKVYIPTMVKTLIGRELTPRKIKQKNYLVYGEPGLPPTASLRKLFSQMGEVRPRPSVHQFNLAVAQLADKHLDQFMALDGTQLDDCTIILRKSEPSKYYVPEAVIQEVKAKYGGSFDEFTEMGSNAQGDYWDDEAPTADAEAEELWKDVHA